MKRQLCRNLGRPDAPGWAAGICHLVLVVAMSTPAGAQDHPMDPLTWEVASALVINRSTPRHVNTCDGEWSIEGAHPLASAVLFGSTMLISYETPSTATGYRRPEREIR